ncbi:MAG: hypothetical protein BGO98_04665 [Myxococcales bacterium 68-20]|nr:MAG: hypothetical protein BGO98_04665 [Myxococcales bacterium 68-20]
MASCSSDGDDEIDLHVSDAGPDAPMTDDASTLDDGASDPVESRDAGWFDGGPLPISCVSPPCATSLVTTLGAIDADRSEGFCALLGDGTAVCWGANGAGQLGRGQTDTEDSPTAARVAGLTDIVQLDHTCALSKSGAASCWGTGPYLRDDAGAVTTEREPVKLPIPPAKRVSKGPEVTCASVDDGLLCWGKNTFAQLAPIDSAPSWAELAPRAMPLPPGAPIRDVVVGGASFALREDGSTLSWGANPPLARITSLFPDPHPRAIALGHVSSIDVTSNSACATAGGIGYCWGASYEVVSGSQTNRPRLDRALPQPVVAPEPLVGIATTRIIIKLVDAMLVVERPQRWCAVAASGAVYCWGYNASGQAGDGTKDHAFEAVMVKGLPAPAAQVRTMLDSTCALLTTGKIYCWGSNYYGQLGSGKLKVPSLVPQEVVLP